VHGSPLGEEEVKAAKEHLGWPLKPDFHVPEDVLRHYREAVERGRSGQEEWKKLFAAYVKKHPDLAASWEVMWSGGLPEGWEESMPSFSPKDGPVATRVASGKVLNALAPVIQNLIGGDADLAPSTNTYMEDVEDQQKTHPGGRNIRFGVREHAMGAIVNGMAYHGGLIPFGGTFLTFSDYMRGAVRVSALARLHTIWVWTHDSVWLGEDGPTHQSVEHIAALRAIPNLLVLRPADAHETVAAWKVALENKNGPAALVLSRQKLPVLKQSGSAGAERLERGGYVLSDEGKAPDVILIATGSEVSLALQAQEVLKGRGIQARVVSMPCCELFEMQDRKYRDSVLPPTVTARVVVEAGVSMGWHRYAGDAGRLVCQDSFGASAPMEVLQEKFGFTPERVADEAEKAVRGS